MARNDSLAGLHWGYNGLPMATSGFMRVVGATVVTLGGWAMSSCNLGKGYQDFGDDLTNQEMLVVDGPGTKIADGQLSGMLVDPWGDKGAVVVGFRYLDDGPYLRMQPFDGAPGCNVGRAYRCIVFNRLPNEPQYIAYLDDVTADARGTLYFTNHDCKVVYGPIQNAKLPERLFDSPPGFLVQAGSQLLNVDPFRKKTRVIAEDLWFWSGPGDADSQMPVWYVAGGKLVVLNEAREEVVSAGEAVSEVVFESSDPTRGVFLVDGGKLNRYVEETGVNPKTIAEDVCGASLGAFGIAYYSPCAERKLIIHDPDKGTRFEIDSGVWRMLYAQLRPGLDGVTPEIEVVYTKPSTTNPGFEDLWLKQIGMEPVLWQERVGPFVSATTSPNPTLSAIVESDGNVGRLIHVDSTGETTLAESVSVRYPIESIAGGWMLMTDIDEQQAFGSLVWVNESGERRVVAEHVALDRSDAGQVKTPEYDETYTGIKYDGYYDLRAFLTDNASGFGAITILDRKDLWSPLKLDGKVRNRRFDFMRNMSAISYLDQFDDELGTGTLTVYQTHVGAKSIVSKNVDDYSELMWPYEGVIYSRKEGSKYSVWAARAKP